ncbi:hypothetical protein DFH08DRAFT_1029249 [Mycena albidolilacea]|uniref:Uncharacterized protein n=1 Tax=Mycena albidolilacea TaxID=1033008 RepID=A0AAD7EI84_9AGAR|nr:hypothetical protein DFH08DRAFT_1029249 [Mycena albidolilacea]
MPTLLMPSIFKMIRTTRTTIADGTLRGHTIAVVFSVLSLRGCIAHYVTSAIQPGWHTRAYREAVPFQATVVPLPKQTPAPASAGTATPNPFAGNPFVRQAAGPVNPFVKLQIAGPSSQSSSSKFDNSHFHDDPQPAGSSTETELNSPPTPGHHKYLICVLPYTYRFTTKVQLPGLLQALTARGPVTALEIAERSNTGQKIWLELDSAIRILLTNSGVVLSYSRHHPPPYPFENSSWEAVGPRSATTTHNRVFASLRLLERDFNDHAGKLLHSTNLKHVRHSSQEKIRILFVVTGGKPTVADSDIEMDIIDSSEDEPRLANLVQQLVKAVRAIAGAWHHSLGL